MKAPEFFKMGKCQKRVYPTKRLAQEMLNHCVKEGYESPKHLRIYCCKACKGWHITSHFTRRRHVSTE